MPEPRYPASLIPIKCWKKKLDINDVILAVDKFIVARRIPGIKQDYVDAFIPIDGEIFSLRRTSFLPELDVSNLPLLSMNILSQECEEEHHYFKHTAICIDGEKHKIWDGNRVNPKKIKTQLTLVQPCFLLFWESCNLHNQPYEYKRTFTAKSDFEKAKNDIVGTSVLGFEKLLRDFSKDNQYNIQAVIRLRHSPTHLNYWHVELEIHEYASKEKFIEKAKSGWKYNAVQSVLNNIIRKNIRLEFPQSLLPKSVYLTTNFPILESFEKWLRNRRSRDLIIP